MAILLPYVWTWDGLAFGDGSADRFLHEVTGWAGRTQPRSNKTDKVAGDGAWIGGHYAGPRTIEIKGCWRPGSEAEASAAIDTITGLCSSGDRFQQYVLRRTEGTRDRWTRCVLDDVLEPRRTRGGLIVWETQLFCPDPRWFSGVPTVWDSVGLAAEAAGGLLWNGSSGTSGDGLLWNGSAGTSGGGVEWQQGSGGGGGSVTMRNLGNDYAPVTFTVTAVGGTGLLNPFVRLESTGDVVQYAGLLAVGHSFTVDTGAGSVTVDGSKALNVLSRDELFQLPPNSMNVITFGSSGGSDQGLLTGFHYDAYQGG